MPLIQNKYEIYIFFTTFTNNLVSYYSLKLAKPQEVTEQSRQESLFAHDFPSHANKDLPTKLEFPLVLSNK